MEIAIKWRGFNVFFSEAVLSCTTVVKSRIPMWFPDEWVHKILQQVPTCIWFPTINRAMKSYASIPGTRYRLSDKHDIVVFVTRPFGGGGTHTVDRAHSVARYVAS